MVHYAELSTVDATVRFHAAHRPEHPAILCEDRTVTYGELDRRSNVLARALARAGVGGEDRVAYLARESEHYYSLLFACAKAQAVLVPINWRLIAAEVAYVLRDSGARVVFVEREFMELARQASAGLEQPPHLVVIDTDTDQGGGLQAWTAAVSDEAVPGAVTDDVPLVQMYTSGTTGLPKGVVLAHRSFFKVRDALAAAGCDWIDWRADDVSLIGVPGFHIGGLWWALQGFHAGVTNVAMRVFVGADAVRLIRDHRISVGCVVPAMLQMMLAEPQASRDDFRSLRKVVYGGSPIAESLLLQWIERIGSELAQIYGLTETGNTAVCLPPAEHRAGGSRLAAAGRPYPGVHLKIIDEKGVELPAGGVGEVCVRTPAGMIGYWHQPEATAETLVDGWVHTGDAGHLDEDGFLFISDRIKDTIIVAGENVFPAEIERALAAHPAVVEAAVVGIPDERWGEAVHAFVVLAPNRTGTPHELTLFLRRHLAAFKTPTSFEYLQRLPRNASGKILRRELREKFWHGRTRRVN